MDFLYPEELPLKRPNMLILYRFPYAPILQIKMRIQNRKDPRAVSRQRSQDVQGKRCLLILKCQKETFLQVQLFRQMKATLEKSIRSKEREMSFSLLQLKTFKLFERKKLKSILK